MPLTAHEKTAGRHFRDEQAANLEELNALDPPSFTVPSVLAVIRHQCSARQGRSTSLVLREVYIPSGAYDVFGTDGGLIVTDATELDPPQWMVDTQAYSRVPAGRFGYVYRCGTCRGCGETARSDARLVDGWARPPLQTRARRTTMTDPTGGAQSPEGPSQPGPVYPHPEGMNDPASPEEIEESKPDNKKTR